MFDPGPDEWDLDTLSLVSQMLGAVHGVNGRAAVLLRGAIVCGNIYFDLEKVLATGYWSATFQLHLKGSSRQA